MIESIDVLKSVIEEAVSDTMANEVLDKVMKQLYKSAQERIYDTYNPKDYNRRKTFTKESGYAYSSNDNMELNISAEAEFNSAGNTEANSGNLAELIYNGDGVGGVYGWIPPKDREPTYMYPRPWVDDAEAKVRAKDIFKKEVKNKLKWLGFKVK